MYQTENDIVVKASLPGMKREDIQISVVGDVLTLRGERKR
jgi:HSP20 family protein